MKAVLNDDTIVELEKECDCITHDGPHWLYMDNIWREQNKKMLDDGNPMGFVAEERVRVAEKLSNFKRLNIKKLIIQ